MAGTAAPRRAKDRRTARGVVIGLGCVMLAGCAVGPDYKTPDVAVPATWSTAGASAGQAQLARWWTRLNDPVLNQLVETAVQGNLDVAAAKARIRVARASYRATVGGALPSATASGAASRADAGTGSAYSEIRAGFDASWELDLFGANRRAAEAARDNAQATEADLRDTLLTLIGDVAADYVELRGYQARIALAQSTAATQRQTAALTRTKFEAGTASALDVANAEGTAASTEAGIPTLQASAQQMVHALGVLTGQAPGALQALLAPARAIPAPRLPVPAGIPADILQSRPDVRAAERALAQSTAQIGVAAAALYPDVSLSGAIATTGAGLGDLGRASSISWSFGPSLSVPLFDGGALRADVAMAQAERDQYFVAYKAAVLGALRDVEDALVNLAQERRRNAKLAEAAASYRKAADLSRALYQSGSSSFLDVLDAERSLYSAEDSLLESRVAITTDYIALNKALGGGWDGAVDAARPEVVDAQMGPHRPVPGQ